MSQARVSAPVAEPLSSRDPPDSRAGEDGAALLGQVRAVQSTLRGLFEHHALFDSEALAEVRKTVASVEERLGREELRVVVAGERRSGKSTLLDAIVGDRLLGGARGELAVVTFLRRRAVPDYSARFTRGEIDEFSRRVPDKTAELEAAAARLEAALADALQRCKIGRSTLRQAMETRDRAELDVEQARSGAEGARELAVGASSELRETENEASRLDGAVKDLALRVPESLRVEPPRWAFWLWLFRALFLLFRRSVWRSYHELARERDALRRRVQVERDKAAQAIEARLLAEARLEPLGAGVQDARAHSSEVEQALLQAESERDRLRVEIDELRSKREHHDSERWRQFYADLQALSARRDLVELRIDYPAKLLPENVTIVDIPGMVSESTPEWDLIREQADGCILVSELDRAVSESAKRFLRQLREAVPHVLLVLTKMDQAYDHAVRRGNDDPWGEVELARRIGTKRFARELGRDPDSVLSVAVAAETVFSARDSELGTKFEPEIKKLFRLLRQERALILGARAAGAIRRCIAGIGDAEERAERSYRERILELERKRTPEPAAFREKLLKEGEPVMLAAARESIASAGRTLKDGFLLAQRLAEQIVDSCASKQELYAASERLRVELCEASVKARTEAHLELETGIDREVRSIELGLFEAMRERYQLLHEVRRTTSSSPRLGPPDRDPPSFDSLVPQVREAAGRFKKSRYALGASGAAAGAASGMFIHPWIGPMVGGAIGVLLSFARRESALRSDVLGVCKAALASQEAEYLAELRSAETSVVEAIHLALERSLERAMIRFERYISEPLQAEQQAIDEERRKLAELERIRTEVDEHDRKLERLLEAAAVASVGLCR